MTSIMDWAHQVWVPAGHSVMPVLILLLIVYLVTVQLLRYRRRNEMLQKYHFPTKESMASMTVEQAYEIQFQILMLEFPAISTLAGNYALLKSFGIPSISSLLLSTGQINSPALTTKTKRAVDTGLIVNAFISHPPGHPVTIDAIARMNYLHSHYRKNGKITDADMLYTLSLFALEGRRWIEKYEWRTLTDLEVCAIGVFWKHIGDAMEIPYDLVTPPTQGQVDGNGNNSRSGSDSKHTASPFPDAFSWLSALEAWSLRYEETYMVPAESNARLAEGFFPLALRKLPRSFHASTMHFISIMLGGRLRKAMLLPPPPPRYIHIFSTLVSLRRLFLRHLCLPRTWRNRKIRSPEHPDATTGRFHAIKYRVHPWYMKPKPVKVWSVKTWLKRWQGEILPGDEGTKYKPEGYLIPDLGPDAFVGKGGPQMEDTKEKLRGMMEGGARGCPFARFSEAVAPTATEPLVVG